ncbi:TIR domain-containing protein [Parazoarcus communis]|uniref:TIR domain-containing protein n=2 Tax=Parazoarcus communis TaxID=41977 RepID=A0A2U8GLJ1_9RHOO|nr:TIR domain-containing protein [Parazoarcus communis]
MLESKDGVLRSHRVSLEPARMSLLFVSYRRNDSAGHAGRLTDALELRFGEGSVFRDVDDIAPGENFEHVIQTRISQVRGVLVLIGPRWLEPTETGPRLGHADDFVRREIELALASDTPIVPVLVGGATMPEPSMLPPSIREVATRQAVVLRDASWKIDVALLADALAGPGVLGIELPQPGSPEQRRSAGEAPTVGGRHGPGRVFALLCATFAVAVVAWLLAGSATNEDGDGVAGVWSGTVDYPWGVTREERFEFVVEGGELSGRAGFLGVPRAIEAGRLTDDGLQFELRTRADYGAGDERILVHRYRGVRAGDEIRFRLDAGSGLQAADQVSFIVRRP